MAKKASPLAMGLALGIFFGLLVFVMTLANAAIDGYGAAFTDLIDSIYPWYSVSIGGSIVGLVFGLIDGFVTGIVVAWLYNRFVK